MNIFIDFAKSKIEKVETAPIYSGDNNVDKITLLFKNVTSGIEWYPTLSALCADNSNIYPRLSDTSGTGTTTIDSVTYTYYDFTLSNDNGWNLVPGRILFYVWVNYVNTNGITNGNKCFGTFGCTILGTSGYYLVDNIVVNPQLRMYIEKTFKSLIGGQPRYVNTSTNILALTENKGIAAATDTQKWYYWNGTQYVVGGNYPGVAGYADLEEALQNAVDTLDSALDDKAELDDDTQNIIANSITSNSITVEEIFNNSINLKEIKSTDILKILLSGKSNELYVDESVNGTVSLYAKFNGNFIPILITKLGTNELSVDALKQLGNNGIKIYNNIIPNSNGDLDLGADSKRFNNVYANALTGLMNLEASTGTISSLSSDNISTDDISASTAELDNVTAESITVGGHNVATQNQMQSYAKSMSINTNTYVISLKDGSGNVLSSIDLPLETMVVSGTYDTETKKIKLTLTNGQTIDFSVADLVSGLVSETYLTTNYYNKTDLDVELGKKAKTTDVYMKSETYSKSEAYSKSEVNALLTGDTTSVFSELEGVWA